MAIMMEGEIQHNQTCFFFYFLLAVSTARKKPRQQKEITEQFYST